MEFPEVKRKNPKPAYKKSEAVKELERLADADARRLHPNIDPAYLAPRRFRDDSANGLTDCIVKYITLKGGFASRINNTGIFDRRLNRYRPGTSRKGLADIMGTYLGRSLHIEVKINRDVQSEHQKKVEAEVTRSGGLYFIARDFLWFKKWLDAI